MTFQLNYQLSNIVIYKYEHAYLIKKRFIMLIFFCLFLIFLIYNNKIVSSAARYGLLLWFNDVIPLLLPFILITNLILLRVNISSKAKSTIISIILGVLCGYPIGSYVISYYYEQGIFEKKYAESLLPLCNNVSPMFLAGYIINTKLENQIEFFRALSIIYIPYIFCFIISILFNRAEITNASCSSISVNKTYNHSDNIINKVIETIGFIGVYIIISSVIMECLIELSRYGYNIGIINLNQMHTIEILCSGIEITKGIDKIVILNYLSNKNKIALTLGVTSFGGISSILQTNQVIHNSRLSLKKYMCQKLLCGLLSTILVLIF